MLSRAIGCSWIILLSLFAALASRAGADTPDASTNAPPVRPWAASMLTNPASSTFLQSHPELAQPLDSTQQLTLRPGATPSTSSDAPVVPETSPDSYRLLDLDTSPEDLAKHLLVVYNTKDPDSPSLAQYYATRRNIPAERVLGIPCATTEEITREQYEDTIREPIISYLSEKNWITRQTQHARVGSRSMELLVATRNDIWAIVLIRGIPLKIAPDPSDVDGMESQPELQTNAAAVDSELALLPVFGLPRGGYVPNIFFDNDLSGIKRVGPQLARNMVLVTRLDGPTPADVRRMIDDTLWAENHRLAGLAVVDSRGLTDIRDGYTSGDIWLRAARDELLKDGWTVKFDDKPDVLPASDPCNQVAIYLGWYHDNAIGPWVTPPNRFVRGAIAYHLHSFSANTVRSETSNWVGPLIAHGADATMGMVYEPYLALTPHEDIFTRRLLEGDYFAEAAYASERGLSWMLTVVGDPLYRPFRVPLDTALSAASTPHTPHDDWLLLQKVQGQLRVDPMEDTTDRLVSALDVPGAGPIAEEGLGDLLAKISDPAAASAAEQAYQKAIGGDTTPVDRIRVGLKLAQLYVNEGQDSRALAQLDVLREVFPDDAKRFGVSDALVPTSYPGNPAGKKSAPPDLTPQLPQLQKLPVPTPAPSTR